MVSPRPIRQLILRNPLQTWWKLGTNTSINVLHECNPCSIIRRLIYFSIIHRIKHRFNCLHKLLNLIVQIQNLLRTIMDVSKYKMQYIKYQPSETSAKEKRFQVGYQLSWLFLYLICVHAIRDVIIPVEKWSLSFLKYIKVICTNPHMNTRA